MQDRLVNLGSYPIAPEFAFAVGELLLGGDGTQIRSHIMIEQIRLPIFLLMLTCPTLSSPKEPDIVDLGSARPAWGYDELTAAADLVVVATLQSSESGQYQLYRGDLLQERFSKETLDVVLSKFNVAATLKGTIEQKIIDLVHIFPKDRFVNLSEIRFTRFATTRKIPVLVIVEIDGDAIAASEPTGFRTIKPEYLLFLKLRDDGRYELVSGDSNGQASVRTVNLE